MSRSVTGVLASVAVAAGLWITATPVAAQTCGVLEFTGGGNKITKNVVVNITSLVVSEIDIQGEFEFTMQHGAGEFDNGCPGNSNCLAKFATDNGYENLIVGSVTDGDADDTFQLKMRLFDPGTGTFDRTVNETVHSTPETMLVDIPPLVSELLTGERPKTAAQVMAEKEEEDTALDMEVDLFAEEDEEDMMVFGLGDEDLGITDLEMTEEEIRAKQEEKRRQEEEEDRRRYEEEERIREEREDEERRIRDEERRIREGEERREREDEERRIRDEERLREREDEERLREREDEERLREREDEERLIRDEERRIRDEERLREREDEERRREDEERRRYEEEDDDDADIVIFDSAASEIVIGEEDEDEDDYDSYSYDRYEDDEDDYQRSDSGTSDRRDDEDDYSYDRYDRDEDRDDDRDDDYEDEYERYARSDRYDEDDYDDRRDRDRDRDRDMGDRSHSGGSARFKGEVDKAHVCIKASAGGTYYYQGFFSYGGDIGIHVHRNVLIDMQFKGWTATAKINGEKKTITLIPLAIGASVKGMRGMLHPFIGGDAVFILYQVHPESGARFAPGFKVRGGVDLKLTEVFGIFAGVNVGFAYAKHIKDVDRRLQETQFLVDGSVGILIQL